MRSDKVNRILSVRVDRDVAVYVDYLAGSRKSTRQELLLSWVMANVESERKRMVDTSKKEENWLIPGFLKRRQKAI